MLALPGWNDIQSVTRWHNAFEIAGIVTLAILVVCEVLSFKYGHRREVLQAAAEAASAKETQASEGLYEKELSDLRAKDTASAKTIRELNARQETQTAALAELERQRTVTEPQKRIIQEAIVPYKEAPVQILFDDSDGEAHQYAEKLAIVFRESGWPDLHARAANPQGESEHPMEIETTANAMQVDRGKIPPLASAFARAIFTAGLVHEAAIFKDQKVALDMTSIRIRNKATGHANPAK